MQRVIVTGASGFLGTQLVGRLVEEGSDVIAIDRNQHPHGHPCAFVKGDLSQSGILDPHLSKNTVIFHLAAHASVYESVLDPKGDFQANVTTLIEVLESARRCGCTVLFPSTAATYDPSNNLPLFEKAYVRPSSPYAAAKVAGEAYCAAYYRCYGVDVRIARMFSVYGIGMNRFAIYDFVRKIQQDCSELPVLGDGNQIRDYLYVDDAIEGMLMILRNGRPGEDYNLASGKPVRLADLARMVATLMGYPDITVSYTGRSFPGDVPKWYADTSKIKSIGFEPKVSLEDGIRRTIKWLSPEHVRLNPRT